MNHSQHHRNIDLAVWRVQKLAALHQQKHTLEKLIADIELDTVMRCTCRQGLKEVQRRIDSLEWQVEEAANV